MMKELEGQKASFPKSVVNGNEVRPKLEKLE